MTPLERAHIIVGFFWPDDPQPRHIKENEQYLAAQLKEACAEAENRAVKLGGVVAKDVYDKGFKEGFSAAKEKAKGIFIEKLEEHRNCFTPVCPIEKEVAACISRMEPSPTPPAGAGDGRNTERSA